MFRGGAPGDGAFYERLHARDKYYLADKWEFSQALRCLKDLPQGASVLEIGCGTGAFLDLCRDAGIDRVRGLELNQRARDVCREKGHDVRDELMEQMDAASASFDFVCAFQVLEHVPDPIGFLRAASRLVSAGGKMVLSTPNASSFLARYKWCLLDLPPHHMSRWDEASYRKTAELLGLSIEEIKHEPLAKYHYRFYANSLVEHLPAGSLRRKVSKPIARMGFAAYPWKASIAGHSILTVMSKPQPPGEQG
jgi:2-polyprenyl-3-methyl-5-hydroxy-6-metoxy-1,4-benzoquinol methylase